MFWPALVAFYRTSARHPLYAALNVLGLAFGAAVFLFICLYVRFETTFDRWLPDAGRIYEVSQVRRDLGPQTYYASPVMALDAVRTLRPDVRGTRLLPGYVHLRKDGKTVKEAEYLVDSGFFDVFDLKLVDGSQAGALQPDTVVVSDAFARNYFGRSDVAGRTLPLRDTGHGLIASDHSLFDYKPYRISAVVADNPANASLRFDILRLAEPERLTRYPGWDYWDNAYYRTFLRLDSAHEVADLNSRFDGLVDTFGGNYLAERLYPGRPLHEFLKVRLVSWPDEHLSTRREAAAVMTLGAIGMVALVVALLNYINLAAARAVVRAREVALRKALGARLAVLRLQFLGEALIVGLLAFVLGLSLLELALPAVNRLGGLSLNLDYTEDAALLAGVFGCILSATGLAGLYPAVVLSNYDPAAVFSATRSPQGGRLGHQLRQGLILLQFSGVTALLVMVVVFNAQVAHLQTSDLGFPRDRHLFTDALTDPHLSEDEREAVIRDWAEVPGVEAVAAGVTPGTYLRSNPALELRRLDRPGNKAIAFILLNDLSYFDAYDLKPRHGRSLVASDMMAEFNQFGGAMTINALMNERGVRAFGFETPQAAVGRELVFEDTRFRIVGIVADQRLDAPTEPIRPALYTIDKSSFRMSETIILFDGVRRDVLQARLNAVWRNRHIDLPLDFRSSPEAMDYYYRKDRETTRLVTFGALMAGLVGIIGLYGLAAFSTSSRAVEIGLRKSMGASRGSVVRLLLFQFLRPVLLANLVAWPVAFVVLDRWLKLFDDRVALSPWFFATGSAISLLVAVLTVAGLAFAAAGAMPGKALRHE